VALSLFQGGGYRRVMGGEISVRGWLSRASAALVALLHCWLLQTSSAAIPHDTVDIHEVEADQTERMVGQVRCSASPGSLVLVLRSFETSGQSGGASWFAREGRPHQPVMDWWLARGIHEALGDQSRPRARQITSIPSASGPFCPTLCAKRTRWFCCRVPNPARSTARMWTKTSLPP
jgi:hypothetical protein